MDKKKVLEIEISSSNENILYGCASLELPATVWELKDALDRARIKDENTPYSIEVLNAHYEYLSEIIPEKANLYELNRLVERISDMGEIEHGVLTAFEALVKMDERDKVPHTIDRLIALAESTNDVLVAPAGSDRELGDFVVENEMDERLSSMDDNILSLIDREKIGKEYRESEGGIFLHGMYAVNNGSIKDSPIFKQQEQPLGTVLLKISKGYFNDPAYDNDLTATLTLPAAAYQLDEAIIAVGASSAEECSFTAVDCIVPELTEIISDELYATEGDCYGLASELAKSLEELNTQGKLPLYKAMLDGVSEEITLEDALDLSYQTEGFSLSTELMSSADYAKLQLEKSNAPMVDTLLKMTDLYCYGKALMAENHVLETPYGLLNCENGQTLEQCLSREMPSIGMEMK
ncbi:hypothetical protein [Hungatella sp.]|uniref:hypothetical protein n=1 Tax=Hungatella sp. TaxID=2613924 RepID=UPI002A82124A|nr:hypothetical protein [Hungatella sp.]